MYCIKAENITKRYSGHTALNQVSVSVPEGKVLGLLGPNGAGKTSFIRILTQIIRPDSGEIYFRNEKLAPRHIFETGYLPEERGLYRKMRVKEQLVYLGRLKNLSGREARQRADDWLQRLDLSAWAHHAVEELSKGMQQKVQFIAAVIHRPGLIILDEPFTGFDPVNADLIKKEILELKEKGSTVIFSTHRMDSVEELCDYVVMFHKSEKILEGSLYDIKKEFRSNTFVVEGDGEIPEGSPFEILKQEKKNDILHVRLKSNMPLSENQILEIIMRGMTVKCFQEELPSMEDIFIMKVKAHAHG